MIGVSEMKTIRREWLGVLLIVLLITAGIWVINSCEAARSDSSWVERGNAELLDPEGFSAPATLLQRGRNCYENAIHGTHYTIPRTWGYEDIFNAMVEFHAQRWAWFVLTFGGDCALVDHDTAIMVVVTALRYGIDYRVSIPILLFESTFGMGSHNFYGCIGAWSVSGSFANQTERCFARFAQLAGNNPPAIFGYWHNGDGYWDTYVGNCMEIYRGCDGGDLQ